MLAHFAFDVCYDVFVEIREVAYLRLPTTNFESIGDGLWRPQTRPKMVDFAADFGLAGKKALSGRKHGKYLLLFDVHFLGGAPYHAARRHMGISELTWSIWVDEIKRRVGEELLGRKIFPPAKYFNGELDSYRNRKAPRRVPEKSAASGDVDLGIRAQGRERRREDWKASAARRNFDADAQALIRIRSPLA